MGEMKMEETTTVKKTHPKGSFVCNMTFLLERLAFNGAKSILLLWQKADLASGNQKLP